MQTPTELAALHQSLYAATPTVYSDLPAASTFSSSEHTDYCDGFVMPAAIDFSTLIAVSPRTDGRVLAHSVNFDQSIDRSLSDQLDTRLAQRPRRLQNPLVRLPRRRPLGLARTRLRHLRRLLLHHRRRRPARRRPQLFCLRRGCHCVRRPWRAWRPHHSP